MVARGLTLSGDADLRDAGDNFGNDADILLFMPGIASAASYAFYTGSNDDLIDLDGANSGNQHYILAGAGNDTVLGSGCYLEVFYDFTGNDYVDMRDGNDTIYAGQGKDTLIGGSGRDELVLYIALDSDGNNAGYIEAGLKLDLALKGPQNLGFFGKDVVLGFEDITGTRENDTLLGNSDGNEISGLLGNDTLDGRAGSDSLYGDDGADLFVNATGADLFHLYETDQARDVVRFKSFSDSGLGASANFVDRITSFRANGGATGDVIDLRSLDARISTAANDAFIYRGTGAFNKAGGEVRVRFIQNKGYLVEIDNDADAATEMSFLVEASGTLDKADFLL